MINYIGRVPKRYIMANIVLEQFKTFEIVLMRFRKKKYARCGREPGTILKTVGIGGSVRRRYLRN